MVVLLIIDLAISCAFLRVEKGIDKYCNKIKAQDVHLEND